MGMHMHASVLLQRHIFVQHLDRELDLEAANGKRHLASVVFTHALRYFKECCLKELRDQTTTPISAEDIHWVITVPAIWRQSAKQFMRFAATQVNRTIPWIVLYYP